MSKRKNSDTYMSFMIATETTAVATVPSYEDIPIFDLLRELSGESIGDEKVPCVNCCIAARKGDKQCISSLETPEQPFQITLHCWKSADLKNVPDRDKNIHTHLPQRHYTRATSKLHQLLNHFFLVAAQDSVSHYGKQWGKNVNS